MDGVLSPRERAAQTKRNRTREALITAAIDLVSEAGSYRLEDIASAAGVGLATVYNHFGGKKQLVDAAYERLMSPVTHPIIEVGTAGAYNPPDRLAEVKRYVRDVAVLACDHRGLTSEVVQSWIEDQVDNVVHQVLAPRVVQALNIIVSGSEPMDMFLTPNKTFPGTDLSSVQETCAYHVSAMLLRACQDGQEGEYLAAHVLRHLVASLMHGQNEN
jgi:AcrR family transcriptional regulator